jgi:hypothetical protein
MSMPLHRSPSMREKRSVGKPENHLGDKISLTRKGSNFNVFDTFHFLEKGKKPKIATVLMVSHHEGGDTHNAASADGSAGSERSFPGGIALGKLLFPQ